MKKLKTIGAVLVLVTLLITGVYADTSGEICNECEWTFAEEKEYLEEIGVSAEDMKALEVLFNKFNDENLSEVDMEKLFESYEKIMDKYYEDFEWTFADEKEYLEELGVSSEDMKALEVLFNKFNDDNLSEEEMNKLFESYEKIMDKYYEDFEWTFVEEKEYLEELGISADDMKSLENLFNEIIALEQADQDAEVKWSEYEAIIEKYLDK